MSNAAPFSQEPPQAFEMSPNYQLAKWHTSLCGCFSDCGTCCLGCWCPCVLAGRNFKATGQDDFWVACCIWYWLKMFCCQGLYQYKNRKEIAMRYGLETDSVSACCAHTWCDECALCQDARELKYHQKGTQQHQAYRSDVAPPAQNMQKEP